MLHNNTAPLSAYQDNSILTTFSRQPLNYKGTSALLDQMKTTATLKTQTNELINHNQWLLYHTELEAGSLFAEYEDLGVNNDRAIARLQIKRELIKAELIKLKNKLLTIELRLRNLAFFYRETLLGGVA